LKRTIRLLVPVALTVFLVLSGCSSPSGDAPPAGKPGAPPQPGAEAGKAPETLAGPRPAAVGIDENGQIHPTDPDRCPVCAMKVKEHPAFVCGIQTGDGRTFYFCGTGCMIRSWLHPEIFLAVPREALRRAVVQDYFGGDNVDAFEVSWVAGSDVVGPMGPALVPVRGEEALRAFQRRPGGQTVFRLSEMNDDLWEKVTGRPAVR